MAGHIIKEPTLLVELIIAGRTRLIITRYFAIASRTLLLYDIITNLDREIAYVWGKPWSLMRVIYHLNRIWPVILLGITTATFFVHSPSPESCKKIVIASSYGTTLALLLLTPIIISRVWALYGRSKVILAWLLLGLTALVIAVAVALRIQADSHIYIRNPVPELVRGCLVKFSPTAWVPYVLALFYESLIFGMTLWKSWTLRVKFSSMTFTSQLLRDGTLYYAVILVVLTFSSLGTQIEDLKAAALASGFIVAVSSVMCNRMILSMHAFNNETRVCNIEIPLRRVVSQRNEYDHKSYPTENNIV